MSCSIVRERYTPVVIATDSTNKINSNAIGGFLCTDTGTVTLIAEAQDGKAAVTILDTFAVTAGVYYPMPFYLSSNGGTFTTAGGGAGVLGV
jgi:hypothetical protein